MGGFEDFEGRSELTQFLDEIVRRSNVETEDTVLVVSLQFKLAAVDWWRAHVVSVIRAHLHLNTLRFRLAAIDTELVGKELRSLEIFRHLKRLIRRGLRGGFQYWRSQWTALACRVLRQYG